MAIIFPDELFKSVTFEHQRTLESPGVHGKMSYLILQESDSGGLGWRPGICIFKQAP